MEGHSCQQCGKPASMQCPNCIKCNLQPTYFCGNDCFAKAWPLHKMEHKPRQKLRVHRLSSPASSIGIKSWSIPTKISQNFRDLLTIQPWRHVPAHIKLPDYADTGMPLSERTRRRVSLLANDQDYSIPIASPEVQERVRVACRLGREVLDLAAAAIRPGITTDEIDRIVHEATIARDCYPSPLNYNGFPKSVCTSVNEVICHGIPDKRPLQEGDIVNIDVSVYHNGVHSDLNETYPVGKIDDTSARLIDTCRGALELAIAICKPGVMYRDVGNVISRHVQKAGFSVVRTYCGHGVGELFHGNPSIPHYAKNKAVGVMKPGHIFTIEPMICEGKFEDQLWPDDWTSVTRDGKRSAQFEHTMMITENGVEVLTRSPRQVDGPSETKPEQGEEKEVVSH